MSHLEEDEDDICSIQTLAKGAEFI